MSRSASQSATALRLRAAPFRQVVVGQSAVEDLVGVVHLAVPHHVHDRLLGHAGFVRFRGGARGVGQGGGDAVEGFVIQSSRDEPCFECAATVGRRRRRAGAWKNGGKRHVSVARAEAKSVTGSSVKNTLSMLPGPRNLVRHTGIGQR